jgi:hypothetical protein
LLIFFYSEYFFYFHALDEDIYGPIALASMLILAIIVNFSVNLFDVSTAKA